MLRRSLLPSSFGRFSSSSCFALPLLQQNFSFASTKPKSAVMKTQTKNSKGTKIDFEKLDFSQCVAKAGAHHSDLFRSLSISEARVRKAWHFSKRLARQFCSTTDSRFILRALSAFASLPYSSGLTKRADFALIRLLFRYELSYVDQSYISRIISSLDQKIVAEAPQKQEVIPLPVFQIKKLIGNTKLLTSFDRSIFQCWLLGCKNGDLRRQQRVFLPKHNLVLIRQQRLNSNFSFMRYVPSTKEQFERVWKNSESSSSKKSFYNNLHKLIRKKLKSSAFTPGSIPEGAIKFLRDCGVSDKETTSISGDGFVHPKLHAGSSISPQKAAPRQQTKNITKLIKAIFPDGKY